MAPGDDIKEPQDSSVAGEIVQVEPEPDIERAVEIAMGLYGGTVSGEEH